MIGPAGHVSDHHVGHRRDLTVLGLLDEDGDAARDGLAVELDALSASDELAVAVVTCDPEKRAKESKIYQLRRKTSRLKRGRWKIYNVDR